MDFMSLVGADPFEMEAKANECDAEAGRLDAIISELSSGAGAVFVSWTGIGAKSFNDAITRQIAEIRTAQGSLRQAAAALRRGAGQARSAIEEARKKAEAEKRKRSGG